MFKVSTKRQATDSKFLYILVSALFLSFHYFLVTYVNSSLLSQFLERSEIGILYALGAILSIVVILNMPKIISKWSAYKVMLSLSVLEIGILFLLAFSNETLVVLGAFIVHHAISPILLLCLNTYLEDGSSSKNMGQSRGTFLTIIAIASIISPMVSGNFAEKPETLRTVYVLSAFFMVLFFLTIWKNFKNQKAGVYRAIDIKKEFLEFIQDKNLIRIGLAAIMLHFVFSWLIIYLPLFLANEMGFSWGEIGTLISVTLLPFLLFQIPVGELSDKKYGEKEFLIAGMLFASLAFLIFPFISIKSFFVWTFIIFVARAGASVMETSIESYFYKKSKGRDELISIFSLASPIAFIFGPLFGSTLLLFFPIAQIFPFASFVLLIGVLFTIPLKDTL